jgi:hypothetical protein
MEAAKLLTSRRSAILQRKKTTSNCRPARDKGANGAMAVVPRVFRRQNVLPLPLGGFGSVLAPFISSCVTRQLKPRKSIVRESRLMMLFAAGK